MERDRQPRLRPYERFKRVVGFIFNHIDTKVEPFLSDHWRPSPRIDVGKSERAARAVQLVIAPIQEYGTMLRFTQPEVGVGYTDKPDTAPVHTPFSPTKSVIERTDIVQLEFDLSWEAHVTKGQ